MKCFRHHENKNNNQRNPITDPQRPQVARKTKTPKAIQIMQASRQSHLNCVQI